MAVLDPRAKPLSPSEVNSDFQQYIDFDNQFPRLQSGHLRHTCVNVTCPRCGEVRPTMASTIRQKTIAGTWSALCRPCNSIIGKRDYKIPDNINPLFFPFLAEDTIKYENGTKYIETICPFCNSHRYLTIAALRSKDSADQLNCRSCARKRHPKPSTSLKNYGGYVLLYIDTLDDHARQLARQMLPKDNYVREHRLIMALHLDRPLTKHEVVHHRNGIKDDNRIENLTLLTKNTHHVGHGYPYYQQWQEAESRIRKLEAQISNLKQQLSGEPKCQQ